MNPSILPFSMRIPHFIAGLALLVLALLFLSAGIPAVTLSQSSLMPYTPVAPRISELYPPLPSPPAQHTFIQPGYSYQLNWSVAGNIWAGYGASLRLTLINTGNNELYVYGISLAWDTGLSSSASVSAYVPAHSSAPVGILFFSAPDEGRHSYTVSVSLMAQSPNKAWYDYGMQSSNSWISVDLSPLPSPADYEKKQNPFPYYNMVNSRIGDTPPNFHASVEKIVSDAGVSGSYSIQQVAAVFDWMKANIPYIEDPDGKDIWYTPNETVQRGGGDCEDQAMLLSAMVRELGGTARIYLTDDHAFPVVFVGNDRDSVVKALNRYYGTELQVSFMSDSNGYWIVADTASAFYLGTLPVGASPIRNTSDGWQWDFSSTSVLYSVDCSGLTFTEPKTGFFYLLDSAGLIMFASMLFWSAFHPRKEEEICMVCGNPIIDGEPLMVCQNCGSRFHQNCIAPGSPCPSCGAYALYPVGPLPPPPSDI